MERMRNFGHARLYPVHRGGPPLCVPLQGVASWDGNRFHEKMDTVCFPGYTGNQRIRLVVRDVHFKAATLYTGAHRATDHQWTPFGLYVAKDRFDIKEVGLSGKHWDILLKDDVLYVLSALKPEKKGANWIIRVTATRDLKAWQALFHFESPAFARSFEYQSGAFYFGLGCEAKDVSPETGRILRVPWVP